MLKSKYLVILLVVIFKVFPCFCQIQTRFIKKSGALNVSSLNTVSASAIITYKINKVNTIALLKEDSIQRKDKRPERVGKGNKVNIDLLSEGVKVRERDSTHIYLKIISEGAKFINVAFDQLKLDNKTSIIIYDEAKSMIYGAITSQNISTNKIFWTDVILGESLVIKVSTFGDFSSLNSIRISNVVHGYKAFQKSGIYVGGGSAPCEKDTKCAEGIGWRGVDTSIGMILYHNDYGDSRIATGALINNTAQDFKPLFLTAFHVLDDDSNLLLSANEINVATNYIFRFLYVAQTCGALNESPNYITFNGCSFRSANALSDFALLELNNRPVGLNYAAWDRSSATPSNGAIIHHPSGDVKKISLNNSIFNRDTPFTFPDVNVTVQSNTHWQASWSVGSTEPGSSGGPIFNGDHKIVGQLHGGLAFCGSSGSTNMDLFGRLDISWLGGGTSSTRLSNWLDPINSGAITVETACGTITGPNIICSTGNFVSYPGVIWTSSNTNGLTIDSNGIATRQNNFNGSVTVTATVPEGCVTSKTVLVGSPAADNSTLLYINGQRGVDPITLSPSTAYSFMSDFVVGASSFTWFVPSGFVLVSAKTSSSPGIRTSAVDGTYTLYCSANNVCGSSFTHSLTIIISSGGNQQQRIAVYPNPASTSLNVQFVDSALSNSKIDKLDHSYQLQILNKYSTKVFSLESLDKTVIIPIENLPSDIYFINILYKEAVIQKQIIIQR